MLTPISAEGSPALAFLREGGDERLLILLNLSAEEAHITFSEEEASELHPLSVIYSDTETMTEGLGSASAGFTLAPMGFALLESSLSEGGAR